MKDAGPSPAELRRTERTIRFVGWFILVAVIGCGALSFPKALRWRGRPLSITAEGSESLFRFICGGVVTGIALGVLLLMVARTFRKMRERAR